MHFSVSDAGSSWLLTHVSRPVVLSPLATALATAPLRAQHCTLTVESVALPRRQVQLGALQLACAAFCTAIAHALALASSLQELHSFLFTVGSNKLFKHVLRPLDFSCFATTVATAPLVALHCMVTEEPVLEPILQAQVGAGAATGVGANVVAGALQIDCAASCTSRTQDLARSTSWQGAQCTFLDVGSNWFFTHVLRSLDLRPLATTLAAAPLLALHCNVAVESVDDATRQSQFGAGMGTACPAHPRLDPLLHKPAALEGIVARCALVAISKGAIDHAKAARYALVCVAQREALGVDVRLTTVGGSARQVAATGAAGTSDPALACLCVGDGKKRLR